MTQVDPSTRSSSTEPSTAAVAGGAAGWLEAFTLAAGAALLAAWVLPRGPSTGPQVVAAMVGAAGVGFLGGALSRSPWSSLMMPATTAAVFEIARMGAEGATIDRIRLGSMLGVVGLVLGRVVPAVLTLIPMSAAARVGAAYAGRRTGARLGRGAVSGVAVAAMLMVVAAPAMLRGASTPEIVGPNGRRLPGSVAELAKVEIGGVDQTLLVRGRSVDNPVLLYLHGGPGGADFGAVRRDTTLEQDFVVVAWDQPGAGSSYPAIDPTEELTLDRMVSDTIEVVEYLVDRFDERGVHLVGNSWGSTLGVLAVQRRPELFHSFVGVGQMVSQRETDRLFWESTLAWAEARGDAALRQQLLDQGPPPYSDVYDYEPIVSHEHDWNPYPELDLENEMPAILFVPEYDLMDRINAFRGFLDTNSLLYPQLQEIDFRSDVPRLDTSVTIVLGEHEPAGRADLALEWLADLDAPSKDLVVVEGAGHRAHFDRPALFADIMLGVAEHSARNG